MAGHKKLVLIYTLLIATILWFGGVAQGVPQTLFDPPQVEGEGAALLDVETGRLLWGKNEHLPLPPASTTKIMTVLLGLELGQPEELAVVSRLAQEQIGSRVYLSEGEEYTLRELLYAVQLASANDAAVAVAEHLGGSVEEFARLMNERARQLGAQNTSFVNPNGLPDPDHRTSAYDLAVIGRAALGHPTFQEIITARSYPMSWPGRDEDRQLWNRNRLFQLYEGADGVKTGYTTEAGHCFVGSATRQGRQLVAVVLGSSSQGVWDDTVALLDYGFEAFANEELVHQGDQVAETGVRFGTTVPLEVAEGFVYSLAPGEEQLVSTRIQVEPHLMAPLEQGERVGTYEVYLGSQRLAELPLVTAEAVKRQVYTRWWFWPIAVYAPWRIWVAIRRWRRQRRRRWRY